MVGKCRQSEGGEEVNVLELFCGTKSFSAVAEAMGMDATTIDIDASFHPTITADIMNLSELPKTDIIWASPPCEHFSVASIGRHWNKDHTPKTENARKSILLLEHTINLIKNSGCKYFFIENPCGKMRKMPIMQQFIRHTVTYCQYGDTRMKPTDIWTNCLAWLPRKRCSPGGACHVASPRGSKTGTQGIGNYIDRSRVPEQLCKEILEVILKEAV